MGLKPSPLETQSGPHKGVMEFCRHLSSIGTAQRKGNGGRYIHIYIYPTKTHNLNGVSQTTIVNMYYFYLLGNVLQTDPAFLVATMKDIFILRHFPPQVCKTHKPCAHT